MADITFYSTVAQVIPVIFLAIAIDRGGFSRPLTEAEARRLVTEAEPIDEKIQKATADAFFEAVIGGDPVRREEVREMLEQEVEAREARRIERSVALQVSSVATVTVTGTLLMLFLAISELAALKVTLTGGPTTAARVLCELGLLAGGAALLFSLLDPAMEQFGSAKNWTLSKSQRATTIATFITTGLLLAVWRLL